MDLRQLRYFEAVARHRHFTNAADELHLAQSALSHQVRQLERELGVELLRRTTRSVQPTDAGELVAARARAVLAEVDALKGEIDELSGLHRGQVNIGAMLFGGQLDIPAILAGFKARYPNIEIGLREGTAGRMLEMLADGSLDVTFALEAAPPPGMERLELSQEELAVAMSERHALARLHEPTEPVAVKELAGEELIAFQRGSSTRQLVDNALERAGVEPRIALEGNDFAFVRSVVAQGIGLAILPRSFLERPGAPIAFRPLAPPLRMPVVLWWRAGRRLSPAARAFVDFAATHRPRSERAPARPSRARTARSPRRPPRTARPT
ncbi:MAG: LysR family transcriptional regulator [Solirubrobacteraceae bacterium]